MCSLVPARSCCFLNQKQDKDRLRRLERVMVRRAAVSSPFVDASGPVWVWWFVDLA